MNFQILWITNKHSEAVQINKMNSSQLILFLIMFQVNLYISFNTKERQSTGGFYINRLFFNVLIQQLWNMEITAKAATCAICP